MTTTNTTSEQADRLQSQTLEAAKRAAAIIQGLEPVKRLDQDQETVFLEMGAGLELSIDTAGRFTLDGLERDGQTLLTFTPEETRALYRFWLPISAQAVMHQIAVTVAEHIATKEQEEDEPQAPVPPEQERHIRPQRLELRIAPNCEGDILTHPPRIVAIDGTQFVQLKGHDGWHEPYYPVLEVTRMDAHDGLVLVATPEQVFLMTAQDLDTPIE